jgi:cytochrome c-type biogenesis protein CcmH/NrfG
VGAEEALREATRLRPGDARPLTYLGNVYVLSGRRDDAIRTLDASLALMEEQAAERPRVERLLVALRDGRAAQ